MTSTPTAITLPQLGKFREVITRYKMNNHNKGSVVKRITKKNREHTLCTTAIPVGGHSLKNTFTGVGSTVGSPQRARTIKSTRIGYYSADLL